jgi:hypothetical protein
MGIVEGWQQSLHIIIRGRGGFITLAQHSSQLHNSVLLGIVRQAMQFGLHQWIQLIERARVSAAPRYQKLSDVLLR